MSESDAARLPLMTGEVDVTILSGWLRPGLTIVAAAFRRSG